MKKKFSKKQIAFILVAICLVGLIGIGISYSYYLANISTSNEENKNSDISSATITQVVMDMQGKVSSDGAYPGHKVVKEVIVRGIGEENSIPANAAILITPDLGDFAGDVTWKLYKSEEAITCSSTVHTDDGEFYEEAICNIPENASLELEGSSNFGYKNIVVNPNTETKYYLVVEYANKETDQSDQMGKSFTIDIGLGDKLTPMEAIIASVDTTGKCPTVNEDGSVDVTSAESTDGYLCSVEDAYGTSYYYRGNVTNNYVKFTDKYWRIVRINGDNTVRVIYDGTEAHANGESSDDRQIGVSAYNEKNDDNAYVGYMYGNRDGIVEPTKYSSGTSFTNTITYYIAKEYNYDAITDKFTLKDPIAVLGSNMTSDYIGYYTFRSTSATSSNSYVYKIFDVTAGSSSSSVKYGYVKYGTSSKDVAQTNMNDSTIKTYLDNWYKINILDTKIEKYLADNIFCNDRSFASSNSGTGTGADSTRYRLDSFDTSKTVLKCLQHNDAFTVNDTTNGNGALTYPIGLITADEAALAGGYGSSNNGYYLYSGQNYWTSSPASFDYLQADVRDVGASGDVFFLQNVSFPYVGVRPVLNISQEILNKGDGTMSNPYRIE